MNGNIVNQMQLQISHIVPTSESKIEATVPGAK